jgi:8-oxo-dGTP pyrophosphatase MutT (NUDIX family)
LHILHAYIAANNRVDWAAFTPFMLAGMTLGYVHEEVREVLQRCGHLEDAPGTLRLKNEPSTFEGRSERLKEILHLLIAEGFVARFRDELYAVGPSFSAPPMALADRALMPALGFRAYGIHCNAYVRDEGKTTSNLRTSAPSNLSLWIARRGLDNATDPGKFDHMVAGGQPHGLTLMENLAKEAHEEANVPKAIAAAAQSTGCITYSLQQGHKIRRDTLFVYDLEVPPDFTPHNNDGESFDFRQMSVEEVRQLLETKKDAFKFNVPLVLIHFLIRRGLIHGDEPGYVELVSGLQGALEP